MSLQITHSPRPYTQTFSRTKSNKTETVEDRELRNDRGGKLMEKLKADLDNGDMPLDQRLQDMGFDPKEYRAYVPPILYEIGMGADGMIGSTAASKKRALARRSGNRRHAKMRRRSWSGCASSPTL